MCSADHHWICGDTVGIGCLVLRGKNVTTIHRHSVSETYQEFELDIQEGAQFLSVQLKNGFPEMWFKVDPKAALEKRVFQVFGTGWEIPDNYKYLGTYISPGGHLVWHLHEKIKE